MFIKVFVSVSMGLVLFVSVVALLASNSTKGNWKFDILNKIINFFVLMGSSIFLYNIWY